MDYIYIEVNGYRLFLKIQYWINFWNWRDSLLKSLCKLWSIDNSPSYWLLIIISAVLISWSPTTTWRYLKLHHLHSIRTKASSTPSRLRSLSNPVSVLSQKQLFQGRPGTSGCTWRMGCCFQISAFVDLCRLRYSKMIRVPTFLGGPRAIRAVTRIAMWFHIVPIKPPLTVPWTTKMCTANSYRLPVMNYLLKTR